MRQEALQHMFIALAGTDCREMWTLLVTFFGKGTDQDPFEFLDAAPAIKKPLDLIDTDSDEEETSTAASTTSSPAVAGPSAGTSTKTSAVPATAAKGFKLPPKPTWPDLRSSIDEAEGFIPLSADQLHHTGIPGGVTCKRSGTQTSRGASLYICPLPDCGSTPYVGDLPGCGSHLRRAHYGTCILCPFCPDKRYYRVSGWKDHMKALHSGVPWYGASEELQAELALQALTNPDPSDVEVSQQQLVSEVATASPEPFSSFTASIKPTTKPLKKEPQPKPIVPEFRLPSQEEISTTPLVPYKDDEPLTELLLYTVDDDPDDITAEQEEALLDPEAPEPEGSGVPPHKKKKASSSSC